MSMIMSILNRIEGFNLYRAEQNLKFCQEHPLYSALETSVLGGVALIVWGWIVYGMIQRYLEIRRFRKTLTAWRKPL